MKQYGIIFLCLFACTLIAMLPRIEAATLEDELNAQEESLFEMEDVPDAKEKTWLQQHYGKLLIAGGIATVAAIILAIFMRPQGLTTNLPALVQPTHQSPTYQRSVDFNQQQFSLPPNEPSVLASKPVIIVNRGEGQYENIAQTLAKKLQMPSVTVMSEQEFLNIPQTIEANVVYLAGAFANRLLFNDYTPSFRKIQSKTTGRTVFIAHGPTGDDFKLTGNYDPELNAPAFGLKDSVDWRNRAIYTDARPEQEYLAEDSKPNVENIEKLRDLLLSES